MKRIVFLMLLGIAQVGFAQSSWKAPDEADAMKNPLVEDAKSLTKGEKIFKSLCASCHGQTGKGDVPAMQSLNPKPTDFTTDTFQSQTDGAIFWKLSEGRGLMAAYKNMLSEEDRWAVVNYLRSFNKKIKTETTDNKPDTTPKPKADKVESQPVQQKQSAYVTAQGVEAFPFTTLVNAKTTHIMQPKGFGLTIQHRFGATKFDDGFIKNFMGLDLAANMRFAFEIPFNERLMFEIGRTRYGKFYDMGAKYLFLQQTKNEEIPFSLAFYGNVAITTENAPQYSDQATFDNGTLFEYKFYHRLYYDTQVILSRKFSHQFSAQIAGELVWRNLTPYSVEPKEESFIIAVPISMRYKFGLRSAVSLEVMPNTHENTFPISLGYEVASSGNHVFQITITNSDRMLSQQIFTNPTLAYDKDGFMLGFNLTRYF